ncbi:MAG: hypothetical protein NC419_00555 [Muribaculaceae bacterium]|nr:hypothetical protein [Muribaculaceae bacterium]
MGKFCTQCGRPLQEGEICTCQTGIQTENPMPSMQPQVTPPQQQVPPMQQQVPPTQQQVPPMQQQVPPTQQQVPPMQQVFNNANVQATKELANQVKVNFLQVLRKPVTVGRKMIEESDVKIAFIFLILQAVASSLFGIAVGSKVNNLISAVGGLAGYAGMGSAVAGVLKISYGKIFAVTFILSIIFSCFLALLLVAGHKIIHCEASYKSMLSVASIRSAVMIPVILISLLLFELNVGVGFGLFIIGNIFGFVTMTMTMAEFIPEEKKDIFSFIISIVLLIFVVIVILVMGKGWTLYLPDAIRSVLKSVSSYISNPGQLMQEIVKELIGNIF